MHRRYDTWFFVAAAPDGHAYLHDEGETVASIWIRPADALAAADRGELDLIFPTRKNLEALGRFAHPPTCSTRWRTPPTCRRPRSRASSATRAAPAAAPGRRGLRRRELEAGADAEPTPGRPDARHDARGAERALAARAPDRGREPEPHDRTRHQHVPRRASTRSRSSIPGPTIAKHVSGDRRRVDEASASAGCCSRTPIPTTRRPRRRW